MSPGGSGKSTLIPTVQFFLCTVVLCTKYLDLTTKCNVCVKCTCIMEFATSRTFSAVRKDTYFRQIKMYPEYYNLVDIFLHVHNFYVMVTMCWPVTEWFVQRHSLAWMIHSGPFSWLNDSFRTIQLLEWFIQASQEKSDFCSTKSSLMIHKHVQFQYELQLKQIVIRWKIVQVHSVAWMIHSGPFRFLNDSFRTIQLLEWFIQDHSGAWMIHSWTCF